MLVGHVTKDGQIAGPKVIEHMVDTVLYFEGDRGHAFRILRAAKNRFGATDEIGVFEMAGEGLREVANPSELFLGDRQASAPGSAVFAGVEGTRPILVEIQALVVPSGLGTPRRAVVGWDANRLSMLLAVIDARCGVSFAQHDVYLNVAGGLKITEPAADLAAAAALLSSIVQCALAPDRVYFGEISLSGAVRAGRHVLSRLKEAQKLGFKAAVLPASAEASADHDGLQRLPLTHVRELMAVLSAPASPAPRPADRQRARRSCTWAGAGVRQGIGIPAPPIPLQLCPPSTTAPHRVQLYCVPHQAALEPMRRTAKRGGWARWAARPEPDTGSGL